MHPARLSLLAGRHEPPRKVVARERQPGGCWTLSLECGHVDEVVPHFDCSRTETRPCRECGEAYVRTAPQYAKEFS